MRVLYLVPQPKRPGQLSAYTFLDEEIHGLAAGNVLLEAYGFGPARRLHGIRRAA